MADRYRIYCTEGEVETLPANVEIEARFPAFVIATVPEGAVEEIRRRYPVEKLGPAQAPPEVQAVAAVQTAAASAPARGPYTVAVRFDRPVAKIISGLLADAGAELMQPIGSRTFAVRCASKEVIARVERLPHVEWVRHFVPTIHLTPGFFTTRPASAEELPALVAARDAAPVRRGGRRVFEGLLTAWFLTAGDRDRAYRRLRSSKLGEVSQTGERGLLIDLVASPDRLAATEEIAALGGLARLEEKRLNRYFNDVARAMVGGGVLEPPPDGLGLDGTGEIVAVADSGLDTGDAATVHPDFRGRVRAVQSFPIVPGLSAFLTNPQGDDGAGDRFSGHGTHVTGSVLGNGSRAAALGVEPIQGTAPGADLVFQAVEQETFWNTEGILAWLQAGRQPPSHGLFGIPDDFQELFQAAFDQGARIHSDSWGGGDPGAYDEQCRALDEFVWNHRDFLVVVAAGNDGKNSAPGGGIDAGSVSSPAVAKNCLTVGASENLRPTRSERYADFWDTDFPHPPFGTDLIADDAGDLAAFSSRGPCSTGRRKPDVVAPGTFVLSVRSSQVATNQFGWGSFLPAKQDYMFMGGTSMATPLVSGCAALVRQFLRRERGIANPPAALLKASLIHSAQYTPYRFAAPDSAEFCDNEQGWGRVTLRRLLRPEAPEVVLFVDHTDPLAEGGLFELPFAVATSAVPLRATLVYTDFPGEDLINNLNLFALAPDGRFHLGNDFAGAGSPDGGNNVESVVIRDPEPGTWRLRVVASAVPQGPQDFALVVSFGGEEDAV
jgi:subtilisin family serine protease